MGKSINRGRYGWRFYLNKILGIWREKGESLTFSEIHKEFVKLGIVSNEKYKASTHRILKRLVEEGYLERNREKYKLKVSPKPFDIIGKISEVREKYGDELIYEWRVGGRFWALAEGMILGMPKEVEENSVYKFILNVLLIRLAQIFEALESLAVAAKLAKRRGKNIVDAPIPKTAMREFILNIIPYILGDRSGIDGDGLTTEELIETYKLLTDSLPKEINGQPVMKDLIKNYLRFGMELYRKSANIMRELDEAMFLGGKEAEEKINELVKIVLVAYPSERVIDKQYDERELYELLKHSIVKGYTDALHLAHMRIYEEEVVFRVLNYLEPMLGKERARVLKKLYRLARAGMILDSVVAEYLDFKELKGKPKYIPFKDALDKGILINPFAGKSEEKVIEGLKRRIDEAKRKYNYTIEDMVKGIWLSDWSLNVAPRFTQLYYSGVKDIVNFVEETIKETLEALGVKIPNNLSYLVKEGYDLVKNLDAQLEKDTEVFLKNLRSK